MEGEDKSLKMREVTWEGGGGYERKVKHFSKIKSLSSTLGEVRTHDL